MVSLGPFGFIYFTGTIAIAALLVGAHWDRFAGELPARTPPPDPMDEDPHTLTLVSADGRLDPTRYESFDDYPSALARQRELAARGQGAVVRHADSGTVRPDLDILETYKRMAF